MSKCKRIHAKKPIFVIREVLKENDKAVCMYSKHIPGNSSYAGIAKDRGKVTILHDSIPSEIVMYEFNHYVKIGHVFRIRVPGATAKEVEHYATLPLKEDKPDIVIINTRTNSLNIRDACNISTDIFKLVELCPR